jgi:predicted CoA-binding protein
MTPPTKTVAVVGANSDRRKFGNKSVRAHALAGYTVYPVHPTETTVEGLQAYRSVRDIPLDHVDRVTVYLPPAVGIKVLPDFAAKSVGEVWLNPGADAPEVVARAKELGLNVVTACSIVDLGVNPHEMSDE